LFEISQTSTVWVTMGSPKTHLTHGEILKSVSENRDTLFTDSRLSFWMTAGKEIENIKKMILQGEEVERNNTNNNNNKSYPDRNNLVNENYNPQKSKNSNTPSPGLSKDKNDSFDKLVASQDVPFETIWPIVFKKSKKRKLKIIERKSKRKKQPLIAPFLDQLQSAGATGRKIRRRILKEPFKLLAFAENRRPPFYGLTRKSRSVKPRKPFNKDKNIDYSYDSDFSYDSVKEYEDLEKGSNDSGEDVDEYEADDMIVFTGNDKRGKRKKKSRTIITNNWILS